MIVGGALRGPNVLFVVSLAALTHRCIPDQTQNRLEAGARKFVLICYVASLLIDAAQEDSYLSAL